ncbi:MAG TPA: FAD-dependent oxidoreductase [Puia sp.]|nr:FAD-dependent oxidoreductase [Puia sp.]
MTPQLSVWEKESFFAPADIIIAGSGLVGLWSAYYLKKKAPSLSITIVERGLIPTGASTRNAGFACFGTLSEMIAGAQEMGEEQMLELTAMRYRGLKKISKVFKDKEIGLERNGGYELIPAADNNELRSRIDTFNRLLKDVTGKQKIFRLQNHKLAGFGFAGIQHLIGNDSEAQLHSGKLCQALLRLVQSMGVTVLNNMEITGYEKVHGQVLLHIRNAPSLLSSQLLVATNAFARQILPQLDIVPARGQVIVTSPIENLPFQGTFHFDEGFYYFRNLGDRVLLGGARNKALGEETTAEMELSEKIQRELERFLRDVILPRRHYTIEHRWSGIMAMGSEKMPILKAVNDHVFCAVRMSGMGVALAPVIGEKIATLMTGSGSPGGLTA